MAVTMDSDVTPALPNWVWIQSWQIDSYGPGGLGGGGDGGGGDGVGGSGGGTGGIGGGGAHMALSPANIKLRPVDVPLPLNVTVKIASM